MAIRVLVVDDSPSVCRLLSRQLNGADDVNVVGTANNGEQAVKLVQKLKPDVVTMDQDMPEMGGLESLERIMHDCPTPVVMISGVSQKAADVTMQALDIGAVDFVLKYTPGMNTNASALQKEILAKVRSASQVKVIRSIRPITIGNGSAKTKNKRVKPAQKPSTKPKIKKSEQNGTVKQVAYPIVVIGASTGGPVALRELLAEFPPDFGSAIVVVQHIPATFTDILAKQLDRQVPLPVVEASAGIPIMPGKILVAPGDHHLLFTSDPTAPGRARIQLNKGPHIKGHRPAIDVTMQSAAQHFGSHVSGVVLTGMGDDGTLGLVAIRNKGGKTFAQDAETSVVNGMPQRAIDRGVVDHIGTPKEIASYLLSRKS